jgi:DNA-binding MarR family transcriptional regulator
MDKLCEKKLIERFRCNDDRRVVFITINKEGLNLLDTIDVNSYLEFLNNLTEKEATTLSKLLDKLR